MDLDAIAKEIISAATKMGGNTWFRIQQSAPLYIRGYAQTLLDIAAGVAKGDISKSDAKMYSQTARLMLVQGIANASHVLYSEVQKFIDSVLGIVKASITKALAIPI